ncbi:MAG: four helix bundle protein [Rhodothermales bacterium]
MENQARDILKRSEDYAVRAVKLFQHLQAGADRAGWVLGKQYLRSATSIGANIEEAQDAESRKDFVHKYGIAQKEARESRYWLRVMVRSGLVSEERIAPLLQEANELYAVITAIIRNAKRV